MKPGVTDVQVDDRKTKHGISLVVAYVREVSLYDAFFLFGDVLFSVRFFAADH
jgi:hypothetical protein